MAEERDVPSLEELVSEIETLSANLDKNYPPGVPITAEQVMSELRNTFLPLIKDIAFTAMLDIGDLQDIVDPVKLTQVQAEENAELLKAFAASRPTDAALQERIAAALEPLEGDDDDDGEESEEPEPN